MELQDYTTEQLREELRRRAAEMRARKEEILRCRKCAHFGTITHWGDPIKNPKAWDRCCPYNRTKDGKRYKCNNASQVACEHFEPKKEKKQW